MRPLFDDIINEIHTRRHSKESGGIFESFRLGLVNVLYGGDEPDKNFEL